MLSLRRRCSALMAVVFVLIAFLPRVSFSQTAVDSPDEMLRLIEKERESLKQRELSLKRQEEELEALRQDILKKLGELKLLQSRLSEYFEKLKALNDERILGLAKVCESAPPEKAGKILSRLDPSFAALILLKMNKRKAGPVFANMSPRAAERVARAIEKMVK